MEKPVRMMPSEMVGYLATRAYVLHIKRISAYTAYNFLLLRSVWNLLGRAE